MVDTHELLALSLKLLFVITKLSPGPPQRIFNVFNEPFIVLFLFIPVSTFRHQCIMLVTEVIIFPNQMLKLLDHDGLLLIF
jgi:hypothetical protein